MVIVKHGRMFVLAIAIGWVSFNTAAHADWASCQAKPTRDCLLEEALRGDNGPLTGKDRLDVLIQGGALTHPEFVTPADVAAAQQLARSTPGVGGLYYATVAIQGLVAAHQQQQAIDLVASTSGATQTLAISEVVKDLVKADDLQTALAVTDRMQPLDPKRVLSSRSDIIVAAVKALADIGKTDGALMLMADQKYLTEFQMADLQIAVGQAFARKGDAKLAQATFDQAQKNLEAARSYTIGRSADLQLRFAAIRLLALRGQVDAAKDELQKLRSDAAAADPSTDYERSQGFQRVVAALLDAKQPDAALAVAQSLTPDTLKDVAVANVVVWDANNGKLADARSIFAAMSNTQETFARLVIMRSLAAASTKAGDVASALKLADGIKTPLNRRGTLFLIAQSLPQ